MDSRSKDFLQIESPVGLNPLRQQLLFTKGMVSDDTDHARFTLQALIKSENHPERFSKELRSRFLRWFLQIQPGIGLATLKSGLRLLIRFNPKNSGVFSAGNGPCMRAPVIGIYCEDFSRIIEFNSISTRLTHTDPKAEYGSYAIALTAHFQSHKPDWTPSEFLNQLQTAFPRIDENFMNLLSQALESANRHESLQEFCSKPEFQRSISGYVYHTVPAILQIWFRKPSNTLAALQEMIAAGGDTDTTAAILGAPQTPEELYLLDNIIAWPYPITQLQDLPTSPSSFQEPWMPMVIARNLFLLAIVLAHGFARLFRVDLILPSRPQGK